MVGTNMRGETLTLMDKRASIEAEMNAIIDRLNQPGGPGLSASLVDSQGFPRSDIDIPSVRAQRRRLSELRNDYQDISEKINQNIQILHSARLASKTSPLNVSDGLDTHTSSAVDAGSSMQSVLVTHSPNPMDVDVSIPFAMVDEISDSSPAAEDGLQLGDQILKYGSVEAGDNLLQRLASESQSNMGHAIPVVIMRQGATINLTITPRNWAGRGLLGCHFRIL